MVTMSSMISNVCRLTVSPVIEAVEGVSEVLDSDVARQYHYGAEGGEE